MMIRTAILAMSLAFGGPALAAPVSDDATIVVRIDDLNLASASGRETLDARVMTAARRLCRSDLRGTNELALQSQCIAGALAGAKVQSERAIAEAGRGVQLAALPITAARQIRE
ncbi:MAG TPA: UrcA family protein [Sphingopyxis sp.]|uniref:UrcA family protein n=1 Tax=Sphingopyxis sp. TaxID=1908224 RepID=UPI002BBAD4CA|nr:UrcA family protein [Sphingopyxis sp.]HWW57664.1 UrcA family protein [Sphingopyxis sp.]